MTTIKIKIKNRRKQEVGNKSRMKQVAEKLLRFYDEDLGEKKESEWQWTQPIVSKVEVGARERNQVKLLKLEINDQRCDACCNDKIDQSHFSATLHLSSLVSKKPSARSISYIRTKHPPWRTGQGLQRLGGSDTAQLSDSSGLRCCIYEHPSSLFISLSWGKRNHSQFTEAPLFMFSRETKGRVWS